MAIQENDILIENTDVTISNGDFNILDANNQNIKHILIAQKGDYIGAPSVGTSVYQLLNDNINDLRVVINRIAQGLMKDGYKYPDFFNKTTDIESTKMNIEALRIKIPNREVI